MESDLSQQDEKFLLEARKFALMGYGGTTRGAVDVSKGSGAAAANGPGFPVTG
jgi:hypothetical protein